MRLTLTQTYRHRQRHSLSNRLTHTHTHTYIHSNSHPQQTPIHMLTCTLAYTYSQHNSNTDKHTLHFNTHIHPLEAHSHTCLPPSSSRRVRPPSTTCARVLPLSLSPSSLTPHLVRRVHIRPIRHQHLRHLLVALPGSVMKRRVLVLPGTVAAGNRPATVPAHARRRTPQHQSQHTPRARVVAGAREARRRIMCLRMLCLRLRWRGGCRVLIVGM